jgi:hypothetical protein
MITFRAKEITPVQRDREKINQWLNMMHSSLIKETLYLFTGAQVILLENILDEKTGETLACKGSIGIIVSWTEDTMSDVTGNFVRYPYVQFSFEKNSPPQLSPQEGSQESSSSSSSFFAPVLIKHKKWTDCETGTTYAQLPLAHGWALTVQDTSELLVDSAHLKTGKVIFDSRQFYGCLSKVKNMSTSHLILESFDPSWLRIDPRISQLYRKNLERT